MKMILYAGICLLAATVAWPQTNSLTALLQQGLLEEQANRNFDAAIADYQSLASQFDQDRQLAATAVFRLGECYRAQGRTNEAAAQYQRILRDFSDQQTLATLSRQDLAGMGLAPAGVGNTAAIAEAPGSKSVPGGSALPLADDEDREIQRLQLMLQNSPDLITSPGGGELNRAANAGELRVAAFLLDHGANANSNVNGETPLNAAAMNAQKAMVELLLKRGADVNARGGSGGTALCTAAGAGYQAVVEVLLAHQADVNARYTKLNHEDTPLLLAARGGYPEIVSLLLAHKAQVDAQNDDGETPLCAAAQGGSAKIIQMLVAAGANVNLKDNRGCTALNYAIGSSPEVFQALLAARVNPNTEDSQGRSPLSYAVERGSLQSVNSLLAAKADPNLGKRDAPLLCAINKNDIAAAELLLQKGANPNAKGEVTWPFEINRRPNFGRPITPLYVAVSMDQPPMVRLLLKYQADPNDAQTDGQPLLFGALTDTNLLAALLEAGGKAESRNSDGWTLLDAAVSGKNLAAVQWLLKFKADPNHSQIDRQSILFNALSETNILEALLEAGATVDPVSQDQSHWTPLGAAARNNNAAAVAILLKHGANPNVRNANGVTPLHWAAYGPADKAVFELLLAHQADPNVRNNNGETPLDLIKKSTPQNALALGGLGLPPARPMRLRPGTVDETAASQPEPSPGELADLLRQHGALDKLPDWDSITVSRPAADFSFVMFRKGTNDWDQFTLLETICNFYLASGAYWVREPNGTSLGTSASSMLNFPDLTRVVIVRPTPGSTNKTRLTVNLLNGTNGIDVAKDLPLEFGDVVEIPERDHSLGENAVGLTDHERDTLYAYVKGSVELRAHGQKAELSFYRVGGQATLHALLNDPEARKLLLTSSDLSRVKVIRRDPKTGQQREWTLDCSPPSSSPNGATTISYQWTFGANNPEISPGLWLRDGDVIEVPEKP